MTTKYKNSSDVPDSVLVDRLEQLSDAVVARMKGDESRFSNEFTCRIPADLVLTESAKRLRTKQ